MLNRKIIRYKNHTLKVRSTYNENQMEWFIKCPGNQPKVITDPTSCKYSVAKMKFYLSYAEDAVDYLISQQTLRKANKVPKLLSYVNAKCDLKCFNRLNNDYVYHIKHKQKHNWLVRGLRVRFKKEHHLYLKEMGYE